MDTKARKNVWLIILILVFIGSQVGKAQSAEPNVSPDERIVGFPTDVSVGELSVRNWGSIYTGDWTILGEARGEVTIPAGKELQLKVPSDYSGDFSPLAELGPSDLQSLVLDNTKVGDEDLVYIKGLTSLRSLSIRKRRVVGKRHPLIRKPLGDLKFTSLKGEEIDISRYKGKVVLVDFWAMWCGPCIGELPNVKNTYNKYHDHGFEIIGISLDRDRSRLENFIQSNDMPWPQYFDGKGWKNEIAVRFDIHSIPSTFLLDMDGNVRYANLRGSALKDAVEDLLRGPSQPDGQITSSGMANLKDLTSLELLNLENTQVGDEGLAYLAGLASIKTLVLAGTQVTDEGIKYLKSLTALQTLNLNGTRVSEAGITDLKQALPNCRISEPVARISRVSGYPRWSWGEKIPLRKRILFAAIFIPIVCFLSAVFLKIVTRWTVKFNIPYWTAYKIEIIAAVIGFVIRVPFDVPKILWNLLLSFVVGLLVHSIIYGQMIKHPDTNEPIGFGKGLLIWFYLMLILIPLGVVLGCVIGFALVVFQFIVRGLAV
jgi:peroxiredoxin